MIVEGATCLLRTGGYAHTVRVLRARVAAWLLPSVSELGNRAWSIGVDLHGVSIRLWIEKELKRSANLTSCVGLHSLFVEADLVKKKFETSLNRFACLCHRSTHRDEGSPLDSPIGGRVKPLAAAKERSDVVSELEKVAVSHQVRRKKKNAK